MHKLTRFIDIDKNPTGAYVKLALSEKQEKPIKAFEEALSEIKGMGVKPRSIEVVKKECNTWGDNKDGGECNLEGKTGAKIFRIKVDDSKKTKDGWRMVSYVRVRK